MYHIMLVVEDLGKYNHSVLLDGCFIKILVSIQALCELNGYWSYKGLFNMLGI